MVSITNRLFYDYDINFIYPKDYINRLTRYFQSTKEISLVDLELEMGDNIFSYYFKLTRNMRDISFVKKFLIELPCIIDFYNIHSNNNTYQLDYILPSFLKEFTRDYNVNIIYYKEWCSMLDISILNIINANKGIPKERIIMELQTTILYFWNNISHHIIQNNNYRFLRREIIDMICKILYNSGENIGKYLHNLFSYRHLINEENYSIEDGEYLLYFFFFSNSQLGQMIRNRLIMRYFADEYRNKNYHKIITDIRQKLMFEGDYLLYNNCIIILDGLNKLSKFWLQKKRIPYISKQLLVLQELKSLPATNKYIGGEDYRKSIQLYKKNKNIN